jgi:hypothetical protein
MDRGGEEGMEGQIRKVGGAEAGWNIQLRNDSSELSENISRLGLLPIGHVVFRLCCRQKGDLTEIPAFVPFPL